MNLIKLKCENCGARLEVNSDLNEIICNYCGAKVLIDDEATNITRIEKAKLTARKMNHEQEIKEAEDKIIIWKKRLGLYKTEEEKIKIEKENKKIMIIVAIMFGVAILIGIIASIFGEKNPSLENYNTLKNGMSYQECKRRLDSEGHLIFEENSKSTYVWYDVYCVEEEKDEKGNCPVVIELNFENNKLVDRKENGLK